MDRPTDRPLLYRQTTNELTTNERTTSFNDRLITKRPPVTRLVQITNEQSTNGETTNEQTTIEQTINDKITNGHTTNEQFTKGQITNRQITTDISPTNRPPTGSDLATVQQTDRRICGVSAGRVSFRRRWTFPMFRCDFNVAHDECRGLRNDVAVYATCPTKCRRCSVRPREKDYLCVANRQSVTVTFPPIPLRSSLALCLCLSHSISLAFILALSNYLTLSQPA